MQEPNPVASWVKVLLGTVLVLSSGFAGSVITHEREAQSHDDHIAAVESRLAADEDRMKTGFVTREEFVQFSARVLDGLGRIEDEQIRIRQGLEKHQ